MDMLYNNYLITDIINIIDVKRDSIGDRKINSVAIPSRNGEIFQNSYFGSKQITVDFYMKYDYLPSYLLGKLESSEYQKILRSLVFYLTNNDKPARLIFSDEPNVYHLAITESIDIERTLKIGQGTITFKCLDPYSYELEPEYFTQDENGIITIKNDATASSYPIFTTTLGNNATHLSYISTNGVVQIGGIYESSAVTNEIIFRDKCTSTNNWYAGTSSLLPSGRKIDDGVAIISDGYALRLNNNPTGGANSKNYYGQFMMANLNSSSKYWSATINFTFSSRTSYSSNSNAPDQQGMIEFIFYDSNNVPLASFSMRDYYDKYEHNIPFVYSGMGEFKWSDDSTLGSIKTKSYSQYFNSLDDVPKSATILSESTVPKYKITLINNGTPIYSSYSTSSKLLVKMPAGTVYEYADKTVAYWHKVWLNSEHTNSGWIASSNALKEEDGTRILVTYSLPIDSSSGGNWNDFTGTLVFERVPHDNGIGSIWRMSLHKFIGTDSSGTNSKEVHSVYKNFFDPDNTFTTGGDIRKIGLYIGSYQDANAVLRATFDDIIVRKVSSDVGFDFPTYIGTEGDTITVDMGEQMVYKNGIPFMENVDIGSQFFGVNAFTDSQVRIVTDADCTETIAELTKRWL